MWWPPHLPRAPADGARAFQFDIVSLTRALARVSFAYKGQISMIMGTDTATTRISSGSPSRQ